jgi:alcohol dehydrogenase
VKVSSTCVNPIGTFPRFYPIIPVVDIKLRKHPISSLILPTPKIPGTDISGTVVASAAGSEYSAGDEVIAMMPMLFWSFGASAEYAAVPISLLAPKPKNISFIEASSLPLVGITVVTGFDSVLQKLGGEGALQKSKILVQAGSGGVGSFAVQYAKNG